MFLVLSPSGLMKMYFLEYLDELGTNETFLDSAGDRSKGSSRVEDVPVFRHKLKSPLTRPEHLEDELLARAAASNLTSSPDEFLEGEVKCFCMSTTSLFTTLSSVISKQNVYYFIILWTIIQPFCVFLHLKIVE